MIHEKRMYFNVRIKRFLKIMILTTFTLGIISVILFEEMAMPYIPITPWKRTGAETPESYGLKYDSLAVEVEKGFILRGYFVHSVLPNPLGTMVLLHGIGSCKEANLGFSRHLVFLINELQH